MTAATTVPGIADQATDSPDAACGESETVSPLGTSTQRPPTPPRVRPWSDDEGPGMACDVTTGTCGPGAPSHDPATEDDDA